MNGECLLLRHSGTSVQAVCDFQPSDFLPLFHSILAHPVSASAQSSMVVVMQIALATE